MQNMVAAENGGWGGHMGEVVPSRVFLYLFLVPSMRPQLTLRSVDIRSVHPETCFGGGCVPLGSICPCGQIFPFLPPKKHFSMGRIRLSFCMGVNRKHPLLLMIAP